MQIKREESGKNLPVYSCLRELQYNGQILRAGQAKTSIGNTCTCYKTGTEITILDTCINNGAINQSVKKIDVLSEVGEVKVVTVVI